VVRVGIVGASGYTGGELLRLLHRHPNVEIAYLASRTHAGTALRDVSAAVPPNSDLVFKPLEVAEIVDQCDVIFTAVPHGAAMEFGPAVIEAGKRLIDVGTDFRFRDAATYEGWYGVDHTCPELTAKAAYGLPELFREHITGSHLVGNPGCYPTSVLLGLAPVLRAGLVQRDRINITAMSGGSGAGATPSAMLHLPEASENLQVYGVAGHRHTPEIEQGIALVLGEPTAGATNSAVSFTPHLVPMSRGILATMVLFPSETVDADRLQHVYESFYQDEPFVRVLPQDKLPATKPVRGSNMCHLAVRYDERSGRILVFSAIDNLGKGAAGQAVQNMNLVCGLPEDAGVDLMGMYP